MSDPNINKQYEGLRKIYSKLTEAGYYEHGHIINYDEIVKNLHSTNLLVHKTYLILKNPGTKEEKIKQLIQLKDPEGGDLINEATAEIIIERHSDRLVDFYDNIYRYLSQFNQKGGYEKETLYEDNAINHKITDVKESIEDSISNAANNVKYKVVKLGNNITTKITDTVGSSYVAKTAKKKYTSARDIVSDLYKSDFITRIENLFRIDDFLDMIDRLEKKIGFKKFVTDLRIPTILIDAFKFGILKGPRIMYKISVFIFNWTFFPLYKLENLPIIGIFYEIPLDIIALIIDNSDFFIEPIVKVLPIGFDAALKAASMVPGIAPMVGIAKIPLSLIRVPIEFFLENGADMLGLFLNIERKQFGLAYLSALEVFPVLPGIMDTVVTNLYTMNKWIHKGVRFTEFISDCSNATDIISEPYIRDPSLVMRPKYVWDEVIYPNKDDIPILRSVPFDTINQVVSTVKNIKDRFI